MRCKYLGEMGCSSFHLLQEVAFRTGSFRSVRGSSALYTQWPCTIWQTGAFAGDCGRQRHRKHHAVTRLCARKACKAKKRKQHSSEVILGPYSNYSPRSSRANVNSADNLVMLALLQLPRVDHSGDTQNLWFADRIFNVMCVRVKAFCQVSHEPLRCTVLAPSICMNACSSRLCQGCRA